MRVNEPLDASAAWRISKRDRPVKHVLDTSVFSGPVCRRADPEAIIAGMISAEELVGEEWAEWYRLTPAERWRESEKLWQVYLALGGSLDPEPDTQSPFFDPAAQGSRPADGRPGVRVVQRGRI